MKRVSDANDNDRDCGSPDVYLPPELWIAIISQCDRDNQTVIAPVWQHLLTRGAYRSYSNRKIFAMRLVSKAWSRHVYGAVRSVCYLEAVSLMVAGGQLRYVSNLRVLCINGVRVNINDLLIKLAPTLEYLELGEYPHPYNAPLKTLFNLTDLFILYGTDTLRGDTVVSMSSLTSLRVLRDGYNDVCPDAGRIKSTDLPRLRYLGGHLPSIDMEAGCLSRLTTLTALDIAYDHATLDPDIAPLTNLTSLSLRGESQITAASVSKLTRLTRLILNADRHISGETLRALPNLTWLGLVDNTHIGELALDGLSGLTRLDISGNCPVNAATLSSLANLTELDFSRNTYVMHGLLGV